MNTSRVYPFTVGEAPSAAFIMTVDGVPTPLHIARVPAAPHQPPLAGASAPH